MAFPIPLERLSQDRALACEVFFSHRHKNATPDFHVEMMDLWACADEFVAIEAFREAAKSTRAEEFLILEACFKNFAYALIIGETYTKACQRLDAIKHEANSNTKLIAAFGRLRGETWTENQAVFANGVLIEAFGWEQEIRGFLYRNARPDRAFLDDVENKTRVRDAAAVDQSMRKLYLEILPALDKTARKVRVTGTELAADCMLSRLAADKDWLSRRFPLCDRDPYDPLANPLWHARYPLTWCRTEKRRYEEAGMLQEFNQEYMLQPAGRSSSAFTEGMFRFAPSPPLEWAPRHLIVDPARTPRETSSRVGRVVVSRAGSTIYVHRSRGDYLSPSQIIDALFEEHAAPPSPLATVAVEKDSLDEWLLQPIRTRMLATGVSLPLKPISAPRDRDKHAFIAGLQPFFQAGDVVFVGTRANHAQLIAELLNFPSGKLDVANALAYATRIFARAPVYPDFDHSHVVSALEPSSPATPLVLAYAEDQQGAAALLVAVEGQSLYVLADWTSQGPPQDLVEATLALVRSAYPQHRLSTMAPGEAFDLGTRSPLLQALQRARLTPYRGYYTKAARGSLSELIRTRVHGRPRLLVDTRAAATANALAYGYGHPIQADGRPTPEPERNSARTLIEALECLTAARHLAHNANEMPEGTIAAVTPSGHPYITARPTRRTSAS